MLKEILVTIEEHAETCLVIAIVFIFIIDQIKTKKEP